MKLFFEIGTVYRFRMKNQTGIRFIFNGELPEIDGVNYKRIELGYDDFEFRKGGKLERIESHHMFSKMLLNLE
jgi:hypothetical protein